MSRAVEYREVVLFAKKSTDIGDGPVEGSLNRRQPLFVIEHIPVGLCVDFILQLRG